MRPEREFLFIHGSYELPPRTPEVHAERNGVEEHASDLIAATNLGPAVAHQPGQETTFPCEPSQRRHVRGEQYRLEWHPLNTRDAPQALVKGIKVDALAPDGSRGTGAFGRRGELQPFKRLYPS